MSDELQTNVFDQIEQADGEHHGYKVRLADFEGPLDLLIELVRRQKIDIKSIFIYPITEQYLQHIADLSELDLDKAMEFLEMAVWLIEIKVKALLPRFDGTAEDAPRTDGERELIRKLEEYKLFKTASEELRTLESVGAYYRAPDDSVGNVRTVIAQMTMESMLDSLSRLFVRLEQRALIPQERRIVKDRFTVTEKAEAIKRLLAECGQSLFVDLFEPDYTKSEMITTFLSILELLKNAYITAVQNDLFGDIQLRFNYQRRPDIDDDVVIDTYDTDAPSEQLEISQIITEDEVQ